MTRWRYAGLFVLIVLFYFAQIPHWSFSRWQALYVQTGIVSGGNMTHSITTGTWSRQLAVILIGIFGTFVLTRNRLRDLRIRGSMGVGILFFFWWVFASLVWSGDIDLAARRIISFGILWLAAFGVAEYYKQREVLQFLFFASLAFIVLGLIAEATLGTFTPTDPLYSFCGTFQPNHQAWNCAGLALSGIALGDTERGHRFFFYSASVLGIATLMLTKSRTSVAAFVVAIVIYKALVSTRKQRLHWVPIALVIFCGLVPFLVLNRAELASVTEKTALLGKDVEDANTLSGRLPLWKSGLSYFYDRPLVGYGFNAFETPQRVVELERKVGWEASTFHSEYFDLLLGVGLIGAITYVFIVLSGLKRTLLLYKVRRSKYYAMECAIVVCLLVIMLMENPGRDPNVLTFVFFTIMVRRGLLLKSKPHRSPTRCLKRKDGPQLASGPAVS